MTNENQMICLEILFGAIPVNNEKCVKMRDCVATVYPLKCVTVKKKVNKYKYI